MRTLLAILVGLMIWAAPADAQPAVPLPNPMPPIVYAPCPGAEAALGCADHTSGHIIVYLASRERAARFHELGHVFDEQHMTDSTRHRFARIMRYPWRDWWAGDESTVPLAERFAVAYQVCATRRLRPDTLAYWPGDYGYVVNAAQHRKVCALIRSRG